MGKPAPQPQDGSRIDFELACLADCNMILQTQMQRVLANKQHTYDIAALLQAKTLARVMRCIAALPAAEQPRYRAAAYAIIAAA
jgi:hypothetical protein